MDYWAEIELIYDDDVIDHISRHNVTIGEVIHVVEHSKKIVTNLKQDHYAIIGEYYGRCLVIIVTRLKGNKFLLRTARDCSDREKRKYTQKCKK